MVVMGKKKYDSSKCVKISEEIENLSTLEIEKYLLNLSNDERDGYFAWVRQKFIQDEKARIIASRISSITERLAIDRKNNELYGDPNSDKHINALVKDGELTKADGEKHKSWIKKVGLQKISKICTMKWQIKESEKALGKLDPTDEAKAIMNKNRIAGAEKATATKARNKLKKIEENAALERFLNKTDEELQAERDEQKRKEILNRDPYIDELFGIPVQTRWS